MKKISHKILGFIKNYKFSIPTLIVLLIVVGILFSMRDKEVKRDFVVASRVTVAQEVDVTGRVEPAEAVSLAIQAGGKVSTISAKVGQNVVVGQTLLRVNTEDLRVRLARQQADLAKARITLEKAEPKTNAVDDLDKAYEDGFNAVADAFLDLPSIITGIDDMLGQSYLSDNSVRASYGNAGRSYRDDAEAKFYAAETAYKETLKKYRASSRNSPDATIESLILETYETTKKVSDAVKTLNNLLDYIENKTDDGSRPADLASDQSLLTDYTADANDHLTELLAVKDTIKDSKEGIGDEAQDVKSLKIDIRQAELDIEDTLIQIENRTIKSPINGVVTVVDAKVGETISSGSQVISIISSNKFQIEANLPEADVAKVSVGAEADVKLDAYGSDVPFKAKVVSVDPAETILDGVATYKATFEFTQDDERIKSGMTADITVKGMSKENVIAVPQRAVITKDSGKFVQVLEGGVVIDKPVKTGLRGSDGNVEITEGLVEGDQVIVFTETAK